MFALAMVAWNVGLWFAWNYEADRRLRAFVAERRALGEPVLAEDFKDPPVPDDENAAVALHSVAKALWDAGQAASGANKRNPGASEHYTTAERLVPGIGDQIRAALQRPEFQYKIEPRAGSYSGGGRRYVLMEELAGLVRDRGLLHISRGEFDEAWMCLADLSRFIRHLDKGSDRPPDMWHLRTVVHMFHQLASELVGIHQSNCKQPIPAELMVPLCELSTEPAIAQRLWYGLRRDALENAHFRQSPLEFYLPTLQFHLARRRPIAPPKWLNDASYVLHPLTKSIGTLFARKLGELSTSPSTHVFHRRASDQFGIARLPRILTPRSDRSSDPVLNSALLLLEETRKWSAILRLSTCAIALRRYHRDRGELPQELAELVPAYLAVVPTDPYSPEGKPLLLSKRASELGCDPRFGLRRIGANSMSAYVAEIPLRYGAFISLGALGAHNATEAPRELPTPAGDPPSTPRLRNHPEFVDRWAESIVGGARQPGSSPTSQPMSPRGSPP
ncbi:MAG: hypothetical protein SF069_05925 [Phycisphaerae bacterium]|nr:hypothetical protein [Phycisphaerae bacterium]